MRKINLYHTLVIGLLLVCQTTYAMPRLTIVAVVDGLTTENLQTLRPYWQQGGLRTLSEEAYQTTITFPHLVFGGNETTATLVTGTTPDRHGYMMDRYWVRNKRSVQTMLDDPSVHGIGTTMHLSAQDLLSPTLTDRMRIQYPKAKIYALGLQPQTTILLAGHAADGCCWLDAQSQQWVASAAYNDGLPSAAYRMNQSGRINEVSAQQFTPRMDILTYTCPTEEEKKRRFSYSVEQHLTRCPQANTLVIELALALQQDQLLGADATPDMLLMHLNSLSPNASADRIRSAEQEDMYLRLNQDLGYMMEQLDKRIGRENYQILIVGRPVLGIDEQTWNDIHMPIRQFNLDRIAALTSTYLMALYGHERWVDGAYGHSLYLNRALIEQKQMNMETIQRLTANFLMEFGGVQVAMPNYEIIHYPMLRNSLSKRHTGDVVFMLQPGWRLMQDESHPIDQVTDEQPTAPLLLWSGTIRPMPQGQIDATDVANLIF